MLKYVCAEAPCTQLRFFPRFISVVCTAQRGRSREMSKDSKGDADADLVLQIQRILDDCYKDRINFLMENQTDASNLGLIELAQGKFEHNFYSGMAVCWKAVVMEGGVRWIPKRRLRCKVRPPVKLDGRAEFHARASAAVCLLAWIHVRHTYTDGAHLSRAPFDNRVIA